MTGFPINPPNTAIVDQRGNVTPAWYRYFAQIQTAVGSAASASWQDGFLLVPTASALVPSEFLEGGGASLSVNVRTVSADTTLQANDCYLRCNADASPLSVILPAASAYPGRVAHIKKIDASANAVTVAGVGGEVIDGSGSLSIGTSLQSYTLISNGQSGWDII